MSWYDWLWIGWMACFAIFEGIGLVEEHRVTGVEPLTRLIRDRWMRRPEVWFGFLGFWLWLGWHFFLGGAL